MNKKGITLIEGLVVLAIIGLLGVLAAVALDSARERSRDAKRLADVTRISAALELYFNDHNSYPASAELSALGLAATRCLSGDGFVAACDPASQSVYMEPVPTTPDAGLKEQVACGGVENAYCYVGTSEAYRLQFELENNNPEAGLAAGVNCASETGIEPGVCPNIE